MAKSSTRRITIYINGKEVEASVKQIRVKKTNKRKAERGNFCIFVTIKPTPFAMEYENDSQTISPRNAPFHHCNSNESVHFATTLLTVNCQLSTVNWIHTFSAKEKDSETGLSYFGSRYYSSDLSIWLSVDPMSDKYPSLSPYVYCANNPIKLVDPNGEEILIGNYKYTIGADCPADLKGDDAKAWNSLNSIAKHKLGGKVVTALCNSTKEYTISTGCEGSKNLYSKNKVSNGTSNKPGGKISVVSNPSSMENVIAHEMFHAYQDENGQYGKTVHNEVEAFMFEAIVCGTGTENLAPNGNYPIKDPYVAAFLNFKNWDKNPPDSKEGFNSVFGPIRDEFMTKSKASTSDDYRDCDINIPKKNLLRELMFGK